MVRADNKTIRNELNSKSAFKRKLFMEDVLKNDESVKFFTAFPNLACHQLNRGTSDPPHTCQ